MYYCHSREHAVVPLDDRLRFVGFASGQLLLFPAAGPEQHGPEEAGRQASEYTEFAANIFTQRPYLLAYSVVGPPKLPLHGPQQAAVSGLDRADLPLETLPDSRIRIALVTHPALHRRATDAIKAGGVALEVAPESPVQKTIGVVARNSGVLEVELVLSVNIGQVHVQQ